MKLLYSINRVTGNSEAVKGVFRLQVEGVPRMEPGDIVFLRSWYKKPYLSRPIQVSYYSEGEVAFFYQINKEETGLLSCLKENDEVEIIGPFGNIQNETAISA